MQIAKRSVLTCSLIQHVVTIYNQSHLSSIAWILEVGADKIFVSWLRQCELLRAGLQCHKICKPICRKRNTVIKKSGVLSGMFSQVPLLLQRRYTEEGLKERQSCQATCKESLSQ